MALRTGLGQCVQARARFAIRSPACNLAMLKLVESHSKYVEAVRDSVDEDAWKIVRSTQSARLIELLSKWSAPELTDATAALHATKVSSFDPEEKAAITHAINGVMTGGHVSSVAGKEVLKQQEHSHFERYLTASGWDVTLNEAADMADKIRIIVGRAKAIGLLSMTERTAQSISSILVASIPGALEVQRAYTIKSKLLTAFKSMQSSRHLSGGVKATCASFPADPDTFRKSFPHRYDETDLPVPSKLSDALLRQIRTLTPCRRSHTSLREVPADRREVESIGRHGSDVSNAFMPFVRALMNLQQSSSSQLSTPLMVYPTARPAPQLGSVESTPLLALPPGEGIGVDSPPRMAALPSGEGTGVASPPKLLALPAPETPSEPIQGQSCDDRTHPPIATVSGAAAAVRAALIDKAQKAADKKRKADQIEGGGAAKVPAGKPAGKGKAKAKAKASKGKANAKAKAKASTILPVAKANAEAKASAQPSILSGGAKLLLGCGSCRGSPFGCQACKSPDFQGRRWQRTGKRS